MQNNTCPHCRAHISARQRFLPKAGAIHCARCKEVSYLVFGAFWLPDYVVVFCFSMLVQHWFQWPAWIPPVAVVAAFAGLAALSPLRPAREADWKGRFLPLLMVLGLAGVLTLLGGWMVDHGGAVAAPGLVQTIGMLPAPFTC